jgi:hypothetical protein
MRKVEEDCITYRSVGRRPWLKPGRKQHGPDQGQIIHTPAATAGKGVAITANGEMWKLPTAHGQNCASEPMLSSIHTDCRPQHGNGHMWVTGGWNVRTNE